MRIEKFGKKLNLIHVLRHWNHNCNVELDFGVAKDQTMRLPQFEYVTFLLEDLSIVTMLTMDKISFFSTYLSYKMTSNSQEVKLFVELFDSLRFILNQNYNSTVDFFYLCWSHINVFQGQSQRKLTVSAIYL